MSSASSQYPKTLTWVRRIGLAIILLLFAAWLSGAVLYVRGIFGDLDIVLGMVFEDAWTPSAVREAAQGLGIPTALPGWFWLFIEMIIIVSFGGLGLIIFFRKPDYFGTYLGVAFVLMAVSIAGPVTFMLETVAPVFGFILRFLSMLAFLAFVSLLYLFPDGRFMPSWSRWLFPVMVLFSALDSYLETYAPLDGAGFQELVYLGFLGIGLISQVYRYLRVSGPVERLQTKWVLASFSLFFLIVMGSWILFPNVMESSLPPTPTDLLAFMSLYGIINITTMLLLVGLTVAILRYRLWDIDVILRKTLVYGILSVTLVLLYFGVVTLLQNLLSNVSGQQSTIAIVISTLAIAALFNPFRRRIQQFIDRRFYRARYSTEQTLQAFATTTRDEVDIEQLAEALLTVVDETVQPEKVSLWIKQ